MRLAIYLEKHEQHAASEPDQDELAEFMFDD
jgi:hypothetical protein